MENNKALMAQRILLCLYKSLNEAVPWKSFLAEMESVLPCDGAVLQMRQPTLDDAGLVYSNRLDTDYSKDLVAAFHDSPLIYQANGQAFLLSELIISSQQQSSPHYFEYLDKHHVVDILGVNLCHAESGLVYRFRFIRRHPSEPFLAEDKQTIDELIPHLSVAIDLYSDLVSKKTQVFIGEKTASYLGFGLIVLKADGQIVSTNAYADHLLERSKEFFIQQGRLHFHDKGSEQKLRSYLKLMEGEEQADYDCSFQIPCVDNAEKNWMVTLLHYDEIPPELRGDSIGTYSVVLQQRSPLSEEQIGGLFDLTPAESRLAKLLVQGDSLTEAADKLGRSRSTVRAQLATIFAKTGVHKQHQLISHILYAASRFAL